MRVLLEGGDGSGGSKEYVEGVVGEGGVKSSRCLKSERSPREFVLNQRFHVGGEDLSEIRKYRADLISDGRLGPNVNCLCLQLHL